jgi:hypothetical protein
MAGIWRALMLMQVNCGWGMESWIGFAELVSTAFLTAVEFLLVCMFREARKLDATTEKRERSFGSFVGFKRIFEFSRWV